MIIISQYHLINLNISLYIYYIIIYLIGNRKKASNYMIQIYEMNIIDFNTFKNKLFYILHSNMSLISPTYNSYEEDFII